MRGNRARGEAAGGGHRSIPAYAGKPLPARRRRRSVRVYPRVCGETRFMGVDFVSDQGLSPRMRGNRRRRRSVRFRRRSIPAYAGKPPSRGSCPCWTEVYPRVCGETKLAISGQPPARGLSPRMRGNHVVRPPHHDRLGSIPAYAGKPRSRWTPISRRWVYPRVCGETLMPSRGANSAAGLSPRMRGNLLGEWQAEGSDGSIPAYAGKPFDSLPPA